MIDTASPGERRSPVRVLWPKEHGAYGQLLFPLGTALVLGPRLGAVALAGACVAGFVGHEAVLTLLGQRGGRLARNRRRDAIVSLACCATLATALGAWAVVQMAPASRPFVALPVALAMTLAIFISTGREHSTMGEIVAAIALSSCGVPVALAGAVPASRALTCWLVFALSFTLATLAVRSTIARAKNTRAGGPGFPSSTLRSTAASSTALRTGRAGNRIGTTVWLASATIALSLVAASRGWIAPAAPFALLPVCGMAVGLSLFPPHPRRLRTVGWLLVTATAVTAIVLATAR